MSIYESTLQVAISLLPMVTNPLLSQERQPFLVKTNQYNMV